MKRKDRFEKDLTTPFEIFVDKNVLSQNFRTKFLWHDDAELIAKTGKTFSEITNDDIIDDDVRALILESASRKRTSAAIDALARYEEAMRRIVGPNEVIRNAIKVLTTIAFNCGFEVGTMSETSAPENRLRGKEMRALNSSERNRMIALERRREIGEPTRERARELMRRKPHLSWTACANEIAEGRDGRGVARVIEELFPKGDDGKRRYAGDNPREHPGFAGEVP